jgi:FkbM family methyltransferase
MKITDDMNDHVMKVMNGEYNVPYNAINPVILDIGANIGSFTRWASARWKGANIHSYEPMPETYALLVENTDDLPNVRTHNVAVGAENTNKLMFKGLHNIGEASLFQNGEQTQETVEIAMVSAQELPHAHIVKIDTEGAEIEILENLGFQPHVIMLEYHSEAKRRRVEELLIHYNLVKSETNVPNRGVVIYVHKQLFPDSSQVAAESTNKA